MIGVFEFQRIQIFLVSKVVYVYQNNPANQNMTSHLHIDRTL